MVALVDCNNFYASCERVFRPELQGRPVAVLSNNDGCLVSRSDEVKALGIPGAAPAFKYRHLFAQHGVSLFSSNYTLYADMSNRVVEILRQFTPELEVYSIDEAFLQLGGLPATLAGEAALLDLGRHMRRTVLQWLDLPVSVGIAPTRTLAKMANRYVKKHKAELPDGVLTLVQPAHIAQMLASTPVGELWGIGHGLAEKLHQRQVYYADEFVRLPENWVRQHLTVTGWRIQTELRGIPAVQLHDVTERKHTVMVTRSFGRPVTTRTDLEEAVAHYTSQCAIKLRRGQSLAQMVHVFVKTNSHIKTDAQYSAGYSVGLAQASDSTPALLRAAGQALAAIYREGFRYKKAGVILSEITERGSTQAPLFGPAEPPPAKTGPLMQLVDKLNQKHGPGTVFYAKAGIAQPWAMKSELHSPYYTTRWSDLLEVS